MGALREGTDATSLHGAPNPLVLFACYALLFCVACFPVFFFADLPLGDSLNHAARTYILNNLPTDPLLQKYYAVHWDLFSFQSTDLLLPPLARWFGLQAAMQLFVAIAFALLIAGTAAVHRVLFGRVGLWPAAAFLFLYNFPLLSGQISFLFSTGLCLLLFAAWVATERWPRAIRLPVFAGASFGLMLCHFFAFSAYGLLVVCFAFVRARRASTWGEKLRRLAEAGLPLVPSAICFLLFFGPTIYGPTSYGRMLDKTVALLAGTANYGDWPDFLLTLVIIISLWWLNRRKRIAFAIDMRLPVFVLLLTAIAMPSLLRGVFAADLRLPCLLYFLLVAASEVRLEGRRHAIAFATGVLALLLLRVGTTTILWSDIEAGYREFRAADQKLERGSRVAVTPTPHWFISCFAVIDRQVFLPVIYTAATPLALTPEAQLLYSDTLARSRTVRWHPDSSNFASVDPETVRQVEQVGQRISNDDSFSSTIDWSDWPERFDYIIDFHLGHPENPVPALLTEVVRGSYFAIYRIHPPLP